jgi:hypothetical protein
VDSAALEAVVASFYTGQCPVTPETVVGIHDAATKLEVQDLTTSCMQYVTTVISVDNCSTLYANAQICKNTQLLDYVGRWISRNKVSVE